MRALPDFPARRPAAIWRHAATFLLLLMAGVAGAGAQFGDDDLIKTIRGIVRDLAGAPVPDARVFIYTSTNNQIRTLRTDAGGEYAIRGLPGGSDYEVRATFGESQTETRVVTSLLTRADNIVNLTLDGVLDLPAREEAGLGFDTFDGVRLHGEFDLPEGVQAPIPVALLLHGYGETRRVWTRLSDRLLMAGWAVLAVDLRGHGESRTRNGAGLEAEESWRSDPQQFPLDLPAALDWIRSQPRLDTTRIAVIGADVGAALALIAGGRYRDVATVVALNPNLDEALAMAGTARDFTPRAAHIIVTDAGLGARVRQYATGASRVTVLDPPPALDQTPVWLGTGNTLDEILRWLRDTY